jgi:SAM-dependent methyltransferase
MARLLSHAAAEKFYDRFGARQDRQGWYEDAALDELVRQGDFATVRSVVELGCGTGRLAARLLREELPAEATYLGVDLSGTMVELARERLAAWRPRAQVVRDSAIPPFALEPGTCARWISTYVLDLLPPAEIRDQLEQAHRLLAPAGRLGLVSLTPGTGRLGRAVTALWRGLHALRPQLVGGCRPLRLTEYLPPDQWRILHHATVQPWGIASEIIWAGKAGG